MDKINLMWRETGRRVSLFHINAMAAFPFLFWMLFMNWYTFVLAFIGMLFFVYLERKGFTVGVFLRWIRSGLNGKRRISLSLSQRRHFK